MAYCARHNGHFADDAECPFCCQEEFVEQESFNDDDDDDLEDEFESFDCHMDRHGNCGAAGSEECEFECPYNRMLGIRN